MRRVATAWIVLLAMVLSLGVSSAAPKIKETSLSGFVYNAAGPADNSDSTTSRFGYEGIAGVNVSLQGTEFKTTTNDKGYYSFDDVPDGNYVVVFVRDGYANVNKNVKIAKGGLSAQVNVALNPAGTHMVGETVVGPGTVYIAYAERQASQATNVDGTFRANTAQTMRGALVAGADPLSVGGNVPAELRPPEQANPTSTDPNHLMILPPNNPTKATFTTLTTKPVWICFNKTGSSLFVSSTAQMIMVYDSTHGNRLLRNLPTQGAVTDLTLGQDGRYVLAGIMAASSGVMLIDTITNDPGAYLPCPGPPRSTAMAGKFVFACVGDSSRGSVVVLDSTTARQVANIPVGNQPTGIALASTGRLFCANSGSASVSVIDINTMTEIARVPVGINPQKVAVSPDGNRVFVTNKQNNTVSVIDGKSLAVIATTPVSAGPIGVTVNRDGSKAFVACKDAGTIVMLDGKTGAVVHTTMPAPNSSPWGVAVRP